MTGPGCSSLAYGAVTESGSFRMNKDGKTLFRNNYAWNHGDKTLRLFTPDIYFFHLLYIIKYVMSIKKRKEKRKKVCYVYKQVLYAVANVIFLESSGGGVLVTSDYKLNGEKFNDQDSYTFSYQVAWKVPAILNQDFYIAGERALAVTMCHSLHAPFFRGAKILKVPYQPQRNWCDQST